MGQRSVGAQQSRPPPSSQARAISSRVARPLDARRTASLLALSSIAYAPTVPKPVDFFLVLTLRTLTHSARVAPELSMTTMRPLRPIMRSATEGNMAGDRVGIGGKGRGIGVARGPRARGWRRRWTEYARDRVRHPTFARNQPEREYLRVAKIYLISSPLQLRATISGASMTPR